jgi:short-subunit dehydrogenase
VGYGLFGGVEEISAAEARELFDTNVFGLLNVTRAVLPTLRAQSAGRILNIGSSAGFAVGAGRGLYGASKFAVEAITEALHAEVAPLGIHATVVEPGFVPHRVPECGQQTPAGNRYPGVRRHGRQAPHRGGGQRRPSAR